MAKIKFDNADQSATILGTRDHFLRQIENNFNVTTSLRENNLSIEGTDENEVNAAQKTIDALITLHRRGVDLNEMDIINAINSQKKSVLDNFVDLYDQVIIKDFKGRPVRAKNINQQNYVAAINNSDIVFGIGPAGTGKTYLAVSLAIKFLKNNQVEKIIISRPAIEAGESLGFLPGDLKEKVDPYLRPIYDAMYSIVGAEQSTRWIESGIVEVAPLAYMRGRTLSDAFVILDEAQNTTEQQMKMFLTRLGFNSKMIVNGDSSQVDLPSHQKSGLLQAEKILNNIDMVKIIHFESGDVVRNPIVGSIVAAYEKFEDKSNGSSHK